MKKTKTQKTEWVVKSEYEAKRGQKRNSRDRRRNRALELQKLESETVAVDF